MSQRLLLPNRRSHITQKVRIAGQRTLYLSVHDDEHPAEIFHRSRQHCRPFSANPPADLLKSF